jgi:hypothetical protein
MEAEGEFKVDMDFVVSIGATNSRIEPYPGEDRRRKDNDFETWDCIYKISEKTEILNYMNLYSNFSENSEKLKKFLPKCYKCIFFDDRAQSQDEAKTSESYHNPFNDHPKWGVGHKAVKGFLILENLLKGLTNYSFLDCKLGTKTGPKFRHKK